MKNIAVIPARYSSRRFPGKPLFKIDGKTLIQRTWENTSKCPNLQELIVATDDERIFKHVQEFGGQSIMTSNEVATGTDRIAEVLELRKDLQNADAILNIQGDLPTLETQVMSSVLYSLHSSSEASMATAVTVITSEEEAMNPHMVKCVLDENLDAIYFSRGLIPYGSGRYNPDLVYYHHLGIYAYRPQFLLLWKDLKPTPLQLAEDLEQLKVIEHGYRIKVSIVQSKSFGIDHPEDIEKLRPLL